MAGPTVRRRGRRLTVCWWLALAAPWCASPAQVPAPLLSRYQHDVWRAQDGVRLAFTSNLVQTHDGYLWLSTQSGLARFDGHRFAVFDGTNTPALRGRPRLQTYPLLEDREQVLWIGSDIGLLTYQHGTFAAAPNARFGADVATDLVNAAVLAPNGRVWAVTRLGRLFHVSRTAGLRAVPGPRARSLGSTFAVDAGGDVWITAGPQGVFRAHRDAAGGDTVSAVRFPSPPPLDEVTRILATADGALWFGTTSAVVEWKHGRLRRVPLPVRSALGAVSCLAVGADGALWIGTEGAGLYRYDGHGFAHVARADGLSTGAGTSGSPPATASIGSVRVLSRCSPRRPAFPPTYPGRSSVIARGRCGWRRPLAACSTAGWQAGAPTSPRRKPSAAPIA